MRRLSDSLPMLLLRAREATLSHFRPALKDFGLTELQWRVLRVLDDCGEVSAQQLADECCVFSQSISRVMRRMEADRLILTRISPRDNRLILIRLSKKGKRLFDKIGPEIETKYREIRRQLSGEKLAILYETLNELAEFHEDHILDDATDSPGTAKRGTAKRSIPAA